MPSYDYDCLTCGIAERRVPYSRRDEQDCGRCGRRMKRLPHYGSVTLDCPESFTTVHRSTVPDYPINDEVRKTWDECGVTGRGGRWV